MISSFARPMPTTRGRRCVPPQPGMIPIDTSGWPSFAAADAYRMSHASASSQPPPRAKPLTAAIVGLGIVSSSVAVSCPRSPQACACSMSIAGHGLDVGAGDERPLAGSGQHDDANVGVAGELGQAVA